MEPFEIMVSESQERMLAVVEPDEGRRGDRPLRALGDRRRGGRRGHRRRATSGCCATARWSARCRSRRWSTSARCTTSSRPSPTAGSTGTDATLEAARQPAPTLLELLGLAEHRQQAMGVRAVRLDRALAHRAPTRGIRRRGPASARGRGDDRGLDRRQRPPGRLRSLRGHGRGGARVRPEPRLRGRRAARAHQLPQLRQPGEAGGRLAARPLDPGARRRLRGARRAGRRRQRLALQRDRGRARSTRPRSSAWSASSPDPERAGGLALARRRRDRGLRPVRALARRLGAGEAARRARARAPVAADRRGRGRDRGGPRRGRVRARSAAPTTSPTAASPARWPRWRSPAESGLEADLDQLVEARGCSGETALFGEGPGGFVVAGDRGRARAARATAGSTCS